MINQLVSVTGWKHARTGHFVAFTAPVADRPWPLLVWPDRGLGIADAYLRAFYDTIAAAMKEPGYPDGLASRDWLPWSAARLDHDEGVVYLSGPARAEQAAIGYRPVARLGVAIADLRHLRVRIATYLGQTGRL